MGAPHSESRRFRFAVFDVDLESGELRKQGRKVALHEQPFQALILLLEHPGEVVTREQLRERLWPAETFVEFDKNLNTTISKLREVLGDSAVHPRFIETLPRRGYRFLAPVEKLLAPKQQQTRTRRGAYSIAALIAVLILGWTIYRARPAVSSTGSFPSIAVLPFSNEGNAEQEYLSDTLTDEMIYTLSRIDGLNVVARTSSFKFKGKNEDVRVVGKALGVGAIMEGSVARNPNDRLRINVRLVSASDGFQMWSDTYDRELTDISSVQQDIAQAVVKTLKIKLASGSARRFSLPYTDNVEAQTLYLQACHMQRRRTRDGFTKSIEYFQKCVALDPQFALAYADMAYSYAALGTFHFLRPKEVMPTAKDTVLKAMELQPELGRAHSVLAYIRWAYDWDWEKAEREYKRAVSLAPGDASSHRSYGGFLLQQERYGESIVELRRAEQLDPLSPFTVRLIGDWFQAHGDLARALEYQ